MDNILEIYTYIIRIPIVLLSLTVHEVSHGYAAYKLGDPTARNLGRLSLNPIKHLDPLGALCMLFFRFGWAKPVPINTRYFKKPRRDMALSALAGPLSNILMSFAAFIASMYFFKYGCHDGFLNLELTTDKIAYLFFLFLWMFYEMNLCLGVFNLIPIPPLDGSRILFVFLPDKAYFGIMKYDQYISIALIVGLWTGILSYPLSWLIGWIEQAFTFLVQFLPFL